MNHTIKDIINRLFCGDALLELKKFPDDYIDTIVTSPPYWSLRSYFSKNDINKGKEIGQEDTLQEYIENLLEITEQLFRILKPTGVLWYNHGDSYGGSGQTQGASLNRTGIDQRSIDAFVTTSPPSRNHTPKCMTMQGMRLVKEMIDQQGWILRARIPWIKQFWDAQQNIVIGTAMPMPHRDRVAYSWEEVFMLTKQSTYWYDWISTALPNTENPDAIRPLPGVWHIRVAQSQLNGQVAHFAKMPEKLIEICLKLSCPTKVCNNCGEPYKIIGDFGDPYETRPGKTSKYFLDDAPRISSGIYKKKVRSFLGVKIQVNCDCNSNSIPGIVFDPFAGSGTTLYVAKKMGYRYSGIELNEDYCNLAKDRIKDIHQQLNLTV